MRLKTLGALAVTMAGVCLSASWARANSIDPTPIIGGSGPAAGAGAFSETALGGGEWKYSVTFELGANEFLNTGDFFTLDALNGATVSDESFTGGPWTDNSTASAVTFTYSGLDSGITTGSSPVILGTLTFDADQDFSSLPIADINDSTLGGQDDGNGQVGGHAHYDGGTPNGIRLVVAPLPSAAWMGMSTLLGVAGLGLVRRRRLA